MVAVRHLGFFKFDFWTFLRVRRANVQQRAKFRRNRSKRCWNIAIYPFFCKMTAICHFGFVGQILGRLTTRIWWSLSLCKFCCNRITRVDNIKVWIFCTFGLKTSIHTNFWAVLGVKIRKNGQLLNSDPSRNAITRNWRHIKLTAWKSVLRFSLRMRAKFGVTNKG